MQTIPLGGVPVQDAAAAAVAIVASIENPDITLGSKQIPPKNPVINTDVYTLLNDGDALSNNDITKLENDIKIAICDDKFNINDNADKAIIGISKVLALNIKLILYKYYNLNEKINNITIPENKQTVIDTFSNFVENIPSLETIDSNTKYISSNYILNFKLKKTQIESIKYTDKLTDTQIKNIHPRNIQYFGIGEQIYSKYLEFVKPKPKYNEMYFSAEQILDLIKINTNTSVLKDVDFKSLNITNGIINSDIYGPDKTVGNVICTAVNLYYYICNEIKIIINKDITKLVNQYFDLMLLLYYTVNGPHNSSQKEEYDKFLQEQLNIIIELDNNPDTINTTELTKFKATFKDKNEIKPNNFFNNIFDIDTCNLTLVKVYKDNTTNNSNKFLEAMAIYYTTPTEANKSIKSYKDYLKYLYKNVSPPTHSFTVDDAHTELKDYTKFINKIYLESYVKKRKQNLNIQPIVLDKDNLNQHYANMCKCKDPKLSLFIYDTSFTNYLNTGTEIEPNTSEIVSEGRQDKQTKTLKTLPEINYMSLGIPFFDKKDIIEKLKTNSKSITTNNKPDTEMTNYAEYENESTLITIDNNTKNDAYEIFLQSLINIYIFVKTHSKDKDLTIYYCSESKNINNDINKYTIDFNKNTVITNNNTMWNSENHIKLIKEHISYLFQQIETLYTEGKFQYNHGQDAYDSTYKICNIDEGLAIESIKIVKNNKTCNDIKTESTPSDIEDTSEITNGYIEKDKEINKQYIEIEKLIKKLSDAYKNLQDIKTDTLSNTKAENKKIYESILNKFTTEKQKFIELIEIQKQILETKIKHINTEITQLKKDLGQAGGSGTGKVLIPTPTSPSKTPPKLTIEVIASKKELLVTKEKELIKCKELLITYDTQQQTIETLTKPIIQDVNAAYPDIQQSVSVNPLTQQKALETKYELIINEKTPSLQNILLSIDKIKFSEQYNNVRTACNNIISITNTIDKNYAVLLPNMQKLTQYLNKLITIEPNVKDIIVKPPPTTLTAFSFILKPDPNSPEGQEFQSLTGTHKIASLIQQNTLAAAMFADTTVLSDSEIQTYLLNLSTENKIATANLFTQNMKLIDSEYNINKFISAVTKYYTPSIPGIEKQVCNIYKNLLSLDIYFFISTLINADLNGAINILRKYTNYKYNDPKGLNLFNPENITL